MVYSKEYNYNLNRYEYIKGVQPRTPPMYHYLSFKYCF